MSLHKAKTLTGEWVTGDYISDKEEIRTNDEYGYMYQVQVNPSTLCQQVPTKDWFVGDEVTCQYGTGYLEFNEEDLSFNIRFHGGRSEYLSLILNRYFVKPTGKNKHDYE
jgi:hypothetical protein